MEQLYIGRGNDAENAALLAFLDEIFFEDDEDGGCFLELLPKIYKDRYRPAYNNFVVRQPDGVFRAAVGNFDNDMLVGGVRLKTCCIGNVAVGKAFRGMGYMARLMNVSVADMKARGVDFSYLGGLRQRYAYFGYENAGSVYDFRFSRQAHKHALRGIESGFAVEPLAAGDAAAIRFINGIYAKAPVISLRPPEAYFDILRSWYDTPYLIKENGVNVGYAVLGSEKDRVSEFGLVNPALLPRFAAAMLAFTGKESLGFSVAPYESEKLKFFTENAEGMCVCHGESVMVLQWKKVLAAFMNARAACEPLCEGSLTVRVNGVCGAETLRLTAGPQGVSVTEYEGEPAYELSALAAVRAFFSNYPADRAAFPPAVRQWLPLPMYISTRDTM